MAATSSEPPLPNKIEDLYEMMGENGDEEFEIKQSELDQLKVALKDETFRKLLSNYVEEVRVSNLIYIIPKLCIEAWPFIQFSVHPGPGESSDVPV